MTRNLKKKIFGSLALFVFATPWSSFALDLPDYLTDIEKRNISVFNTVSAAVVNINATAVRRVGFFTFNLKEVPAGSGSGFVWDDRGHIVTNYHVIQPAVEARGKVAVVFKNGDMLRAYIVGHAPKKDIAVLKVTLPQKLKIKPIPVADSTKLLVGQTTMAVGSPFGLDQSFTKGVVSALGREIDGVGGVTIKGVIQTDASINPGNSGGPLLDSRGYLIGINTAIFSKSGAYDGIGFAVPSSTVQRAVDQIIKYGRVKEPSLGASYFDDSISFRLGIKGLIIKDVFNGTGGQQAGLKGTTRDQRGNIILGDIIVAINDKKVRTYDDLYSELDRKKIGETVRVRIQRGNKTRSLKIKLVDINNVTD